MQELHALHSQRHQEAGQLQASPAAEDVESQAESLGPKLAAAEERLLEADEAVASFTLQLKVRPQHLPFESLASAWKTAFNKYANSRFLDLDREISNPAGACSRQHSDASCTGQLEIASSDAHCH